MKTLKIKLRRALKRDWDYILYLRNDITYRNNFYTRHTITKKEHYDYLKKQQKNPNFYNWIITNGNKDIGYMRVLGNDVSIIIDKKFQKRSIGSIALKLLEYEAKKYKIDKLVGRIMIHNKASQKIFLRNNYKLLMYWYEKQIK